MGQSLTAKCGCSSEEGEHTFPTSDQPQDRPVQAVSKRQWEDAINRNNMDAIHSLSEEFNHASIEETVFANGDRAIHRAIEKNNLELLIYLVNTCEVKMDVPDAKGNTPLSLAVQNNRIEMIKFFSGQHSFYSLLDTSAVDAKDIVNEDGKSAMDYAALPGNSEIWDLLSREKNDGNQEKGMDEVVEPSTPNDSSVMEDSDAKQESDGEEKIQETELDPNVDLQKVFSGWLQKRRAASKSKPRFVITVGEYIGWAENEVDVDDIQSNKKLFKKFYHLRDIHGVDKMQVNDDDDDENDEKWFRFRGAQSALKSVVYEFQAESKQERDVWVAELCARIEAVTGQKVVQ